MVSIKNWLLTKPFRILKLAWMGREKRKDKTELVKLYTKYLLKTTIDQALTIYVFTGLAATWSMINIPFDRAQNKKRKTCVEEI